MRGVMLWWCVGEGVATRAANAIPYEAEASHNTTTTRTLCDTSISSNTHLGTLLAIEYHPGLAYSNQTGTVHCHNETDQWIIPDDANSTTSTKRPALFSDIY